MSVNQPYVEIELLQQVAPGDKMAFRRLFDQLWASVYSAALQFTRSPEMAPDQGAICFLPQFILCIHIFMSFLVGFSRQLSHVHVLAGT